MTNGEFEVYLTLFVLIVFQFGLVGLAFYGMIKGIHEEAKEAGFETSQEYLDSLK
jgi:hypothetical protein